MFVSFFHLVRCSQFVIILSIEKRSVAGIFFLNHPIHNLSFSHFLWQIAFLSSHLKSICSYLHENHLFFHCIFYRSQVFMLFFWINKFFLMNFDEQSREESNTWMNSFASLIVLNLFMCCLSQSLLVFRCYDETEKQLLRQWNVRVWYHNYKEQEVSLLCWVTLASLQSQRRVCCRCHQDRVLGIVVWWVFHFLSLGFVHSVLITVVECQQDSLWINEIKSKERNTLCGHFDEQNK